MSTGLTTIGYGWVLLSIVAAGCTAAGFYIPVWLVGTLQMSGRKVEATFGAFRRCNFPVYDENISKYRLEIACGRYATFKDIPSFYWQTATLTIGAGVCLGILLAFIVAAAVCVGDVVSRTSALVIGLFQVVSAVCVSVGCVLYPIGWDNAEVREACGVYSGQYLLGNCNLGWSFYLMLGGAALLLVCGSLSTKSGQPIAWMQLERRRLSSLNTNNSIETNGQQQRRRQSSLRTTSIIPRPSENGGDAKRLSTS